MRVIKKMTLFWVNYCFKCFKILHFYRFGLFNSIFCIYSHAVFIIRHDSPRKHPNLGGYERTHNPPPPPRKADIARSQLFVNKSRCATVPEDFAQVQTALREPSLYFPNANKTTGSQMRPFIHLLSAGIKVCQHSLSLPLWPNSEARLFRRSRLSPARGLQWESFRGGREGEGV